MLKACAGWGEARKPASVASHPPPLTAPRAHAEHGFAVARRGNSGVSPSGQNRCCISDEVDVSASQENAVRRAWTAVRSAPSERAAGQRVFHGCAPLHPPLDGEGGAVRRRVG